MAGKQRVTASKGKGKAKASASSSNNGLPSVYQDMLAEALPSQSNTPDRPLKKRKTAGQRDVTVASSSKAKESLPLAEVDTEDEDIEFEDVLSSPPPEKAQQTIYRSDDSEDSAVDWDPLEFDANDDDEETQGDLELTLKARPTPVLKTPPKRRAITKAERSTRLEIHKLHVLCLLSHVSRRNGWCNDTVVQKSLRALLDKKMVQFLNPKSDLSQFGRTESLKRGLEMVSAVFRKRFTITERGLRRALWADNPEDVQNYKLPSDVDSTLDKTDFREAAQKLEGSRDLGAQLYCALLRFAGVDARLVCSLQPLSFIPGGPPMPKPSRSPKETAVKASVPKVVESQASSPFSNPRRRLGHPNAATYLVPMNNAPATTPKVATKVIRESQYPVYWVEVFDEAHQKWFPVDPLVTESIAKPRVFEPPALDRENNMSYVIAFEDDGTAKDVTRRYTKAFNAKTRKSRVESTDGGSKWWNKTMRLYARDWVTDTDQIEDTELAANEAKEPMPKNIADFKDHPVYALERHLKRNEVLVRTQEIGKVAAGRDASLPGGKKLESVYRRRDVKVARSADAWYRLGRDVKMGEMPVKVAPPKAKPGDADDEEEQAWINLYSVDQTDLYKSPPCVDGQVPKNSFGNLDLFVPSMIPEGGIHIPDDNSARAARTLGIDYADALTGFEFRGRHGTAVLKGVVVAIEFREAMEAVISGFKDEAAQEEERLRSVAALKKWKHFLMSLRIKRRVDGYEAEGDEDGDEMFDSEVYQGSLEEDDSYAMEEVDSDAYSDFGGGGFIPE